MGLETGSTIADLNDKWPAGTDPKSQGDDHIRLTKHVLKNDVYSKALGEVVQTAGDTMTGTLAIDAATSLTTTGNVGIGTNSPQALLDIKPAASTAGSIAGSQLLVRNDGDAIVGIGSKTDNAVIKTQLDGLSNGNITHYRGSNYGGNNAMYMGVGGTPDHLGISVNNGGEFGFNSGYGAVATAYGCRAWGYIANTGALNGNGNISSVTVNAAGDYTVNFTNAMPDATYAILVTPFYGAAGSSYATVYNRQTGSFSFRSYEAGGTISGATAHCVAVFR